MYHVLSGMSSEKNSQLFKKIHTIKRGCKKNLHFEGKTVIEV
jgi:hypothetical protein